MCDTIFLQLSNTDAHNSIVMSMTHCKFLTIHPCTVLIFPNKIMVFYKNHDYVRILKQIQMRIPKF